MKVLFIHQNFPAQFLHMAAGLAQEPGNQVVALTMHDNPAPAGVTVRRYALLRARGSDMHPFLPEHEAQLLRAEGCAAAAFQLKREGFTPDVIVAHPGWGEALFMKDVFPRARLVMYCEYHYAAEGQDVGFDPEFGAPNFELRCRVRLKNNVGLQALDAADAGFAPTAWQKSTYPAWAQAKIDVIHDGFDLDALAPDPRARLHLAKGGRTFASGVGDELVTYVARHLEPMRGFHIFMRALPEILRRRPRAHAIVVGADTPGYDIPAPGRRGWRRFLLDEVGAELDMERVHFLDSVAYGTYRTVLDVSAAHVYWTAPFVLSWSFLEAALGGTPVIASATPPVLEFAEAFGVPTLPYFDTAALADAVAERLAQPARRPRPAAGAAFEVGALTRRRIALLRSLL